MKKVLNNFLIDLPKASIGFWDWYIISGNHNIIKKNATEDTNTNNILHFPKKIIWSTERELTKEIKSNSYERLIDKPDKIDIIAPVKNSSGTFIALKTCDGVVFLDEHADPLETQILYSSSL